MQTKKCANLGGHETHEWLPIGARVYRKCPGVVVTFPDPDVDRMDKYELMNATENLIRELCNRKDPYQASLVKRLLDFYQLRQLEPWE